MAQKSQFVETKTIWIRNAFKETICCSPIRARRVHVATHVARAGPLHSSQSQHENPALFTTEGNSLACDWSVTIKTTNPVRGVVSSLSGRGSALRAGFPAFSCSASLLYCTTSVYIENRGVFCQKGVVFSPTPPPFID